MGHHLNEHVQQPLIVISEIWVSDIKGLVDNFPLTTSTLLASFKWLSKRSWDFIKSPKLPCDRLPCVQWTKMLITLYYYYQGELWRTGNGETSPHLPHGYALSSNWRYFLLSLLPFQSLLLSTFSEFILPNPSWIPVKLPVFIMGNS